MDERRVRFKDLISQIKTKLVSLTARSWGNQGHGDIGMLDRKIEMLECINEILKEGIEEDEDGIGEVNND